MSRSSTSEPTPPTAFRRFAAAVVRAPAFPPAREDLRTVNVVGLEMPFRAAVAIAFVTMAVVFDYTRIFIPESIQVLGRAAEAMRFQAIERAVLYGAVPLAIVVLVFRDSPGRYGLQLGDWRWGAALGLIGVAIMTPVALALAAVPQFGDYYAVSAATPLELVATHTLDLVATEFLIRGFLMFTLVRTFGGIGVLIATLPFVFSHLGKPELELFSTLLGGLIYGWVDWRTGSILYSAVAHIWILSVLLIAAGG